MNFMTTSAFVAMQTLILHKFSIILCGAEIYNLICPLSSNTVIFSSVFSLHSFWDETLSQTWQYPTVLLIFTGELQAEQSYAWITVIPSILTTFAFTFFRKWKHWVLSLVTSMLALLFWVTVVVSVVFKTRLSINFWILSFVRLQHKLFFTKKQSPYFLFCLSRWVFLSSMVSHPFLSLFPVVVCILVLWHQQCYILHIHWSVGYYMVLHEGLSFKIYFSSLNRSEVVRNNIVISVATSEAFYFTSIAGIIIWYFTEQVAFLCWETNTAIHIASILYWKVEVLSWFVFRKH